MFYHLFFYIIDSRKRALSCQTQTYNSTLLQLAISNEYNFSYIYVRVAAVYGITGVTGVEANTVYSVLHTGNTEFCFCFFQ